MYVSTPAPLQLLVLYLQGERAKMQMPILAPRAFHLHAEAWDGEEGRVQTSSGIRGMEKLGRPGCSLPLSIQRTSSHQPAGPGRHVVCNCSLQQNSRLSCCPFNQTLVSFLPLNDRSPDRVRNCLKQTIPGRSGRGRGRFLECPL